jgi:hypothetical protein
MTVREEFLADVRSTLSERIEEQGLRPTVETWPADDEFAHWVAYHEAKSKAVICSTPEYQDTPFRGTGWH